MANVQCPKCGSYNVVSCPGGTCYKPSEQAKKDIQLICAECLNEFGIDGELCLCAKPTATKGVFTCTRTEKQCPFDSVDGTGDHYTCDEMINALMGN